VSTRGLLINHLPCVGRAGVPEFVSNLLAVLSAGLGSAGLILAVAESVLGCWGALSVHFRFMAVLRDHNHRQGKHQPPGSSSDLTRLDDEAPYLSTELSTLGPSSDEGEPPWVAAENPSEPPAPAAATEEGVEALGGSVSCLAAGGVTLQGVVERLAAAETHVTPTIGHTDRREGEETEIVVTLGAPSPASSASTPPLTPPPLVLNTGPPSGVLRPSPSPLRQRHESPPESGSPAQPQHQQSTEMAPAVGDTTGLPQPPTEGAPAAPTTGGAWSPVKDADNPHLTELVRASRSRTVIRRFHASVATVRAVNAFQGGSSDRETSGLAATPVLLPAAETAGGADGTRGDGIVRPIAVAAVSGLSLAHTHPLVWSREELEPPHQDGPDGVP